MNRVVVVGGSLAGVHAAEALRERGFEGEVTLVSADSELPYDRPPLSKEMLFGEVEAQELQLRPASWYEEKNITTRLGTRASALDVADGRLLLSDGSELDYDGLVLATGSAARRVESMSSSRVHVVRTLDDARALRAELIAGRHLVMIGGGFIGLEVAGVARALGLDVTVIERSSKPLTRFFGDEVATWYRQLHERHGVRVICDCRVSSIDDAPGGVTATLNDGTRVAGDIVVAGVGADPAVDWLDGSGVELSDGVVCTPELRTSVPGVVAAGDIARWRHPTFDDDMRVEHWTNAVEQGRHAAGTLLGDRTPFSSVPYFWTDQHNTKMRFVGRAKGADEARVLSASEDKLVAVLGRAGVLTGAVCVGSPRLLAKYKLAIQNRTSWHEVLEDAMATTI